MSIEPNALYPAVVPATSLRGTDGEEVVFTLNPSERRLFFDHRNDFPKGAVWTDDVDQADPGAWQEMLEAVRPRVLVTCWSSPLLPEEWLKASDCSLDYICHVTGSVREIVPRAFLERGGRVTNWGTLASRQVAEHALLLTLSALRRLPQWRRVSRSPDAAPGDGLLETRTLFGRRVGIHGFGRVACALLNLLKPFDVSVSAFSSGVPSELMTSRNVQPCDSLAELFAGSDVLIECEALTPATAGSVTADVLAALPDGAVFVNVGRGHVVDEPALIREAARGRIQIGLDVLTDEPLRPESAVAQLPDAILSPHIAGPTVDRLPRCGDFALENINRYLRGEPLEAEVTLEIYDRST